MTVLKRGSTGPAVAELQRLLDSRLVPNPRLVTDGQFGQKTYDAVRGYQRETWLVVDGQAGLCTMNALRGTEAYMIDYSIRLVPQPTDTTCWAAATAMLLNESVQSVLRRNSSFSTSGGLPNDSEFDDPRTMERYAAANRLGLMYGQSWTATGFAATMQGRGALMMNILWNPVGYLSLDPDNPGQYLGSSGHMVVASGIRGDGTEKGTTLRIHDPWRPGRGQVRSFNYLLWMAAHPTGTYQLLHRQ
ncbi:MAG: peptidoglycan-binding protein [Gemmatimonadetes bacterium]|nr:peptidoglycan-binding protein [Gemmatimonadota bacterium]